MSKWLVRDKSFYKRLFTLALPMAGGNIISFGVSFTDNIMVSHLGESAVGGIYVVNQVQFVLQMLLLGLGGALVILAAQYYGKSDLRSVKTIAAISMKLAVGIGAAITAAMLLFGKPVLSLLTDDAAVLGEALSYTGIVAWSFILMCVSNVLTASLRCAGSVKIGIWAALTSFIMNIVGNAVFIFGLLGFPAMGVRGAALATLLSRAAELTIIIIYVLFRDKKLSLRPRDFLLRSRSLTRDYFIYGLPVILGDVLWGIGGAAQAAIIGRLGEEVIAASAMAGNIASLLAVMVYGTSGAGALMVGQRVGANDFDSAKSYAKTLQLVYLAIGIVTGAITFSIRNAVPLFFPGVSGATLAHTSRFIAVLSLTIVGTSYQMSSLQIVRSGGATHFVLVNDLIFVWLVVIPLSYAAAFWWNAAPWVVFLCLKSDQILKCSVAVVKVNRFKWMKNLTRQTE